MKPFAFSLLVFGFGLLGMACSKEDDNSGPVEKQPVNKAELQHLVEIKNDYAEKLSQDNAFAFDLLRTTAKFDNKPNLLVSPLSVAMALNMTLNGAAGETLDEMLAALRTAGYTPEQVNAYSDKLLGALIRVDPNAKLSIANAIWYRQGFPVLQPFIDTNATSYDAAVEATNFAAPATLGRINGWISDHTGGKIEKALDRISPDAVMYLVNAIYFKSAWEFAFDKAKTADRPFRNGDGTTSSTPTMAMIGELKYGVDADAAYLELPYANGTFSMVLALPKEDKTIGGLVENLDAERWNTVLSGMHGTHVDLTLPRFSFKGDYLLNEQILPEMGMHKAFDKDEADFSKMATLRPNDLLYISRVIHKTFIEVAEEGTEAAAATVVEMEYVSFNPGSGARPIPFHVDRSFAFAIKENTTGTILFIGTVGKL